MRAYIPRPGSAVALAISFLEEHGSAATSADLAAGIGIKQANLSPCLKSGTKHGLIARQRVDGKLLWQLGDGTPLDASQTETETETESDPEPFACALFSDGELCLMHAGRGDEELVLTKDQTLTLIDYLSQFDRKAAAVPSTPVVS